MALMPVVGHHDELEAKIASMVEPCGDRRGRARAVARHEGVIAVEQNGAFARRPERVEVDELHARHVSFGESTLIF